MIRQASLTWGRQENGALWVRTAFAGPLERFKTTQYFSRHAFTEPFTAASPETSSFATSYGWGYLEPRSMNLKAVVVLGNPYLNERTLSRGRVSRNLAAAADDLFAEETVTLTAHIDVPPAPPAH